MSFYVADWYSGIIRPEFADDMERVMEAHDWSAAKGETLAKMISAGLGEYTRFPDRYEEVEDLPANSYDKETRTLCYGMYGNQHGDFWYRTYNMFTYILPVITERVISYYGWTEESGQINTEMAHCFQKDMIEAEKLLREQGFEGFLRHLM